VQQEILYGNDPNPAMRFWPLKTGQKNKQVTPAEKRLATCQECRKILLKKVRNILA
jgi:hypothetical protein